MWNNKKDPVIIDESTIYELDLECLKCKENENRQNRSNEESNDNEFKSENRRNE